MSSESMAEATELKTEPGTIPTTASPPFDALDADLIIRTSDKVDFHVYKLILREASPVFRDMLAFSGPSGDEASQRVVDVTEDRDVWNHILRILYPIAGRNDLATTLTHEAYSPLLRAANKYDMAAVREFVARAVKDSIESQSKALQCYALACGYAFPRDVAEAAARASFRSWPGDRPPPRFVPDVPCMTLSAYNRLLRYRMACIQAAIDVNYFKPFPSWDKKPKLRRLDVFQLPHSQEEDKTCPQSQMHSAIRLRYYFDDYFKRSQDALRIEPSGVVVATASMLAPMLRAAERCTQCRKIDSEAFILLANDYSSKIENAVRAIRLEE
ncbi:uncharacterized protein B0H18DRAFT_1213582 [Fomitopsis serialis]|uniref:uncharacterized protein n=1 Tax=Fomitopsis serialis TaxID=139415 RepID=UPI0020076480|nr:uncharacterized protein B0H18DRAFT_1213582 [Neoantrodia serialis]KAH9919894.1 hypothetical protein B0H18DRAFT_1213582 [Neoantrodia serialis]